MTFLQKFLSYDLFPLTAVESVPSRNEYKYFTILLNEDKANLHLQGSLDEGGTCSFPSSSEPEKQKQSEDIILKLGRLLKEKIQAHSGENVELFTGEEVIANNSPALVSVMFRLATEDFLRRSEAVFKIIECRNSTKLSTEWKPSLLDVILSLGHQVILVELTDFPHYTDFAYSILRHINYDWKIRVPRSFFYPDDVCKVDYSNDQQVVVVTPLMPDGEIDIASRIQDNLKYEILRMIKDSCANGLRNHLLKRDFRVGKFSDTEIGVNSIRHIYRTLQRRLEEQGSNIQMGKNSEDFHQFLLSVAGDSLMSAESYIEYCKNPGLDSPRGKDSCVDKSQMLQVAAQDNSFEQKDLSEVMEMNEATEAFPVIHTQEGGTKNATNKARGDNEQGSKVVSEPDVFDEIVKAIKELDLKSSDIISNSEPYHHTSTDETTNSLAGSGDAVSTYN